LFLVDGSLDPESYAPPGTSRERPTLRVPVSKTRGGLILPTLYPGIGYNLFDNLRSVFSHEWHFQVLFHQEMGLRALDPRSLLYLISTSLLESNQRYLDREIKRIGFNDLRQPNVKVNETLHDCREDLVRLRDDIVQTKASMPHKVVDWYSNLFDQPRIKYLADRHPMKKCEDILTDVDESHNFLLDNFHLLMSTVSTLDAQTSLEQATRGTRLTQLAFVYLPLSVVTGIFGMNMKEINGSPLSLWVSVVCLVIVIVCTIAIFCGLKLVEDHREQVKLRRENAPQRALLSSRHVMQDVPAKRSIMQRVRGHRTSQGTTGIDEEKA
jgi:hypothetical protein